jgi:segregation and condensation protein B
MARDASTPLRSGKRSGQRNAAARRASRNGVHSDPKAKAAACENGVAAPPAAAEPEDDLLRVVEAMLFAAHESLSAKRIARAIGYVGEARISAAIASLARRCDEQRSPLMLAEIAGGWRLVTRPEYAPFLSRLFSKAEKERLSQAALETLAIVAYRQPATRAEIEAVRGVLVGPLLRVLQERRLIKVVGRAEVVGRPLQYGTTKRFLDHFGLASIADLPKVFPAGRPLPGPDPANEGSEALNGTAPAAAGPESESKPETEAGRAPPPQAAADAPPAEPSPEPPAPRIETAPEGDAAPMALAAQG